MQKDATSKLEYDKFPGLLENPAGYRKGSDDYGVTFAVPIKYVPRLQPLMQKAGRVFVVYLVQVSSPEQAEYLMQRDDGISVGQIGSPEPEMLDRTIVPVEVMAEVLGIDPRTVQLDAEKGLLVRTTRGQYDTLASCGTLRKALREAESGANDAYNDERTASMRLKRQEREVTLLERIKKLTDADAVTRAFVKLLALINQKMNMMPKALSPRMEMVTAVEAENIMDEWKRRLQSELSAQDIGKLVTQEAQVVEPKPEAPADIAAKRRKRRKSKK